MSYKPLSTARYRQYIKIIGWSLEKGGIDWKLYDEHGSFLCTIIISHGKKTKEEIVAYSVQQTERICKKRGLKWPPKKK
jgi:hypothetical protein